MLLFACVLDSLIGDPQYSFHPVRLVGLCVQKTQNLLYQLKLNGFWGGVWLVIITLGLSLFGLGLINFLVSFTNHNYGLNAVLYYTLEVYLVYSLVALKELNAYGQQVAAAILVGDLSLTRETVSQICSRDTNNLNYLAAGRATAESLSENFSDSFVSPLFWYSIFGVFGLLAFKVVSTLDSMVGYKNTQYFYFGKTAAKLDDALNYIPARLSWLLFSTVALLHPSYNFKQAITAPFIHPQPSFGPNRIWPEASAAGALNIRLGGPIWRFQKLAEQAFIGCPQSPIGATATDIKRLIKLNQLAALLFFGICFLGVYYA